MVLSGEEVREDLQPSPSPDSANLCHVQDLVRRWSRNQPQLMLVFDPLHP